MKGGRMESGKEGLVYITAIYIILMIVIVWIIDNKDECIIKNDNWYMYGGGSLLLISGIFIAVVGYRI